MKLSVDKFFMEKFASLFKSGKGVRRGGGERMFEKLGCLLSKVIVPQLTKQPIS
jgi:hypothetical protein